MAAVRTFGLGFAVDKAFREQGSELAPPLLQLKMPRVFPGQSLPG